MKVGIIGAGHVGGTLAGRLSALGHQVYIANSRRPASLSELAREIGAKEATTQEAAQWGEVVIISIPMKNVPDLPRKIFQGLPDHRRRQRRVQSP